LLKATSVCGADKIVSADVLGIRSLLLLIVGRAPRFGPEAFRIAESSLGASAAVVFERNELLIALAFHHAEDY
jgi:hypothetical protein